MNATPESASSLFDAGHSHNVPEILPPGLAISTDATYKRHNRQLVALLPRHRVGQIARKHSMPL